jgi:TonB family protein
LPIRSLPVVDAPEWGWHGAALWLLCGLAASMAFAVAGAANVGNIGNVQEKNAAADTDSAPDAIDFDIPSQPLAAALNRYASLSRRPALFSSEIVAGRMSSAVHGRYAPHIALRLLLEGTGVVAEAVEAGPADAFVLKEIAAPAAALNPAAGDGYQGLVQAGVWRALCSDARTVPGAYRSLLRFQVDAAGRLHDAQLLESTGNARRDAALLDTLRTVHIDSAPPPEMAEQTLTMSVLPVNPATGPACADQTEGAP